MLTYFPGTKRRQDLNNFYQEICEQPFRAEHPDAPGILQTLLKQGEFGALGKVPIFESTFLQVTKRCP
ncbi:hypothetical protein lerEdw1_020835 [Lerista edwardsae]|nr:hypothetical protein lerEdw1_020835 [Lerista edwardsae]